MVEIWIKTLTGRSILVYLDRGDTVADLKEKVAEKEGFPYQRNGPEKKRTFRLIYGGRPLEDETQTLSEAGVNRSEAEMLLVLRLRTKHSPDYWKATRVSNFLPLEETALADFTAPHQKREHFVKVDECGKRLVSELQDCVTAVPQSSSSSSDPPSSSSSSSSAPPFPHPVAFSPIGDPDRYNLFAWRIAIQSPIDSPYEGAVIVFLLQFSFQDLSLLKLILESPILHPLVELNESQKVSRHRLYPFPAPPAASVKEILTVIAQRMFDLSHGKGERRVFKKNRALYALAASDMPAYREQVLLHSVHWLTRLLPSEFRRDLSPFLSAPAWMPEQRCETDCCQTSQAFRCSASPLNGCGCARFLCLAHLTEHLLRHPEVSLAQFTPLAIPDKATYFGEHWSSRRCQHAEGAYCSSWSIEIGCLCLPPWAQSDLRARVSNHILRGEKSWDLVWYCSARKMPSDEGVLHFRISSVHFDKCFEDQLPILSSPEQLQKWRASSTPPELAFDVLITADRSQLEVLNLSTTLDRLGLSAGMSFSPCTYARIGSRHLCQGRLPPLPLCPQGHKLLYKPLDSPSTCLHCHAQIPPSQEARLCSRGCFLCDYDLCSSCFDAHASVSDTPHHPASSSESTVGHGNVVVEGLLID